MFLSGYGTADTNDDSVNEEDDANGDTSFSDGLSELLWAGRRIPVENSSRTIRSCVMLLPPYSLNGARDCLTEVGDMILFTFIDGIELLD